MDKQKFLISKKNPFIHAFSIAINVFFRDSGCKGACITRIIKTIIEKQRAWGGGGHIFLPPKIREGFLFLKFGQRGGS